MLIIQDKIHYGQNFHMNSNRQHIRVLWFNKIIDIKGLLRYLFCLKGICFSNPTILYLQFANLMHDCINLIVIICI